MIHSTIFSRGRVVGYMSATASPATKAVIRRTLDRLDKVESLSDTKDAEAVFQLTNDIHTDLLSLPVLGDEEADTRQIIGNALLLAGAAIPLTSQIRASANEYANLSAYGMGSTIARESGRTGAFIGDINILNAAN